MKKINQTFVREIISINGNEFKVECPKRGIVRCLKTKELRIKNPHDQVELCTTA